MSEHGCATAAVEVEGLKGSPSPSFPVLHLEENSGDEVPAGSGLGGGSPPYLPGSSDQVEGGLRVESHYFLPDPPFWSPTEEATLRAAGIYSPFPFSAAEFYPVLGSCDRCNNGYPHQYAAMIRSGVPQTCPCGIPLPHEAVLSLRFMEPL